MPSDPSRLLLTARQAADALAISERTLARITVPHGGLPVVRIGRVVRYSIADITAWIDRAREGPDLAAQIETPPVGDGGAGVQSNNSTRTV